MTNLNGLTVVTSETRLDPVPGIVRFTASDHRMQRRYWSCVCDGGVARASAHICHVHRRCARITYDGSDYDCS